MQDLTQASQDEAQAKFFEINVAETESVAQAVKNVVEWVTSTGKEIGGVVAAAGVGNPGKVRTHTRETKSVLSRSRLI